MSSNFLVNTAKIFLNQVRPYYHRSTPKHWAKDGVKYGLITYYPRHPDHKDPEFKPSKLFLVERVKPRRGNPHWHRKVLQQLGIDDDELTMKQRPKVIVKNTPNICEMLWKIKHLIKVTPIDMPDNLPDVDSISTYLHESGKLYIFPKIDQVRYEATVKHQNNPKRMDNDTIREHLRVQWLNGNDINI